MNTHRRTVVIFTCMLTDEFSRLQWVVKHMWTHRWDLLNPMNNSTRENIEGKRFLRNLCGSHGLETDRDE